MPAKYISRDEAEAIARRTLAFTTADDARVNLQSATHGNTRFARNQVSTAGDAYDATLTVTTAFGKKTASATTNRFDEESLRSVVQTAERLARLVPEDPEYLGELGAQQYPRTSGYFESTANLTPEQRAAAVNAITRPAEAQGLISTGFLDIVTGSTAVATKKGLFAYDTSTVSNLTTTVRTPDGTGSGWAGGAANDWTRMNPAEMADRAIRKAQLSRNPRAVEPGKWTVILEPTAVANIVQLMAGSMDARQADEGRSFFSKAGGGNKIGEKFLDQRVTLVSDPASGIAPVSAFSNQGLPNRRMVWVENGVLRNLQYSRFWAQRQNREPTGFADGFEMAGGNSTIEEMIRSTERGLLVTRFWYIRAVDPRTILYTGLTRDGTFLIENGQITSAAKNLRWNESPIFMLNNVEAMSAPVRVSANESGDADGPVVVPAVKAHDFTFTSLSDAV
ncbi:TldD/PmbA family protein [Longimicrobium sp.]|uniref:TldD/PmbA family protein n=1 Tax=Longimicrobium sp. TaxID=2029185 RepID=UPI002C0BC2B4|nr:TldD/PmbA family protein [Longimicrobium sp.]HSU13781.1 TldD/PmbA family protein [Longimicrobium sp.]